ncbi:MAG TPA: MFS transporter [Candidatus Binatia bacterium]|nr:MFS transporter [Candidatus Binatia bacterium]
MTLPFFYGWMIVGIAMLAGFLGSGVSNVTMAVVLKPITEDLGWSRTLASSAITIGSITGGLLAPLVGPLADRLGPRMLLPVGAALAGTLVVCLSLTYEPWHFYATFVPARALAETLLTGVVPMTAVTNWFYLKRPRAIGLVALSVPLGSFALSLLYQFMIAAYGWRSAFMMLGVALWLFVVLPGFFFLRRQPEDLGLLPDGALPHAKSARADRSERAPEAGEQSWTFKEAARTRALWLLVAAATFYSVSTGGIAFHMVAYFTDVQIPPAAAVGALSAMALTGAFGSGLWGALAEKIHPRALGITTMVLSAAAVVLLMQVRAASAAFVFAIVFGLSARGGFVLMHVLLARYFGRRSFGAITSALEPFHKRGLGVGALLAGMTFDLSGSYQIAFLFFLGNYLIAAVLTSAAHQPLLKTR